MTGKQEFIGLIFLVCILLFGGCNSGSRGKAEALKEVEETKAELLKRIDRKFENPDAHFELGQLYHADGLWAQAEYHYNTALSFDPAHRNSQAAMVKMLADSGDKTKAQLTADIYMNQVSSSAAGSLRLAMAFQKQKMDEYALACYRQALHLAPNSAEVNKQIGYYYLSKGDKVQAQEYLVRSFQLNPNQPEVAGELGRLGIAVKIPRKTEQETKKLDRIAEQSDKEK